MDILQKMEPFEMALVMDHAAADEFLCLGARGQKMMIKRTDLTFTTLVDKKKLEKENKEMNELIRASLMECMAIRGSHESAFHQYGNGWTRLRGWTIDPETFKGEPRICELTRQLSLMQSMCTEMGCNGIIVQDGIGFFINKKWVEIWHEMINIESQHDANDSVVYIVPYEQSVSTAVEDINPSTIDEDIVCAACKKSCDGDKMLICDHPTCKNIGYHMYCLNPPLEQIPDGDWFCPKNHQQLSKHKCPSCRTSLYKTNQELVPKTWGCCYQHHIGFGRESEPIFSTSDVCFQCDTPDFCDYRICEMCESEISGKADMDALLAEEDDDSDVKTEISGSGENENLFREGEEKKFESSSEDEAIVMPKKFVKKKKIVKEKKKKSESKNKKKSVKKEKNRSLEITPPSTNKKNAVGKKNSSQMRKKAKVQIIKSIPLNKKRGRLLVAQKQQQQKKSTESNATASKVPKVADMPKKKIPLITKIATVSKPSSASKIPSNTKIPKMPIAVAPKANPVTSPTQGPVQKQSSNSATMQKKINREKSRFTRIPADGQFSRSQKPKAPKIPKQSKIPKAPQKLKQRPLINRIPTKRQNVSDETFSKILKKSEQFHIPNMMNYLRTRLRVNLPDIVETSKQDEWFKKNPHLLPSNVALQHTYAQSPNFNSMRPMDNRNNFKFASQQQPNLNANRTNLNPQNYPQLPPSQQKQHPNTKFSSRNNMQNSQQQMYPSQPQQRHPLPPPPQQHRQLYPPLPLSPRNIQPQPQQHPHFVQQPHQFDPTGMSRPVPAKPPRFPQIATQPFRPAKVRPRPHSNQKRDSPPRPPILPELMTNQQMPMIPLNNPKIPINHNFTSTLANPPHLTGNNNNLDSQGSITVAVPDAASPGATVTEQDQTNIYTHGIFGSHEKFIRKNDQSKGISGTEADVDILNSDEQDVTTDSHGNSNKNNHNNREGNVDLETQNDRPHNMVANQVNRHPTSTGGGAMQSVNNNTHARINSPVIERIDPSVARPNSNVSRKWDPTSPDFNPLLTQKEEEEYLARLMKIYKARLQESVALREQAIHNTFQDPVLTCLNDPFFIWSDTEFYVRGQKTNRINVNVNIRTSSDSFSVKGTFLAARDIQETLDSSIVLVPTFDISTKPSQNQQLCFAQYLFKKRSRHMKLDLRIPVARVEEISEFVGCRPAVRVMNFVRSPATYQVWLVPLRSLRDRELQCSVYFVKWNFFDHICLDRYRISLNSRRLNLLIQVEHFIAEIIPDKSSANYHLMHHDKKPSIKCNIKLRIFPAVMKTLLERFDITLVSRFPQDAIVGTIKELGLLRDQFLDKFHRRLFGQIPKTLDQFHSLAQFFEFYSFRKRRNSVLAIAERANFIASDRHLIFERTEPNLVEKLLKIHEEFFIAYDKHEGDSKKVSLEEIVASHKHRPAAVADAISQI